jgi:flagellar motor protein MotB
MNKKSPEIENWDADEEKIEVDERWLLTYADKMTLLSGCFLMLFAMSTLDPTRMAKLKEEAAKNFDKQSSNFPLPMTIEKTFELKSELDTKTKLLASLKTQKETLEKTLTSIESKNSSLDRQLREALMAQKNAEEQTKSMRSKIKDPTSVNQVTKLRALESEKNELKNLINELQAKIQAQNQAIEKTNQEIKEKNNNLANSSFLAFVMSWGTRNQDIDLSVTDPEGSLFNFKLRKHANHPGLLVLDTRQGPGVEIWQSDKITPGVYSFNYQFYNSYGNTEPCPVTGTLFTSQGKISLPQITLTPDKKQHTFKVEISSGGKPRLLN